jgi:hypothetical protein
MAGRYAEAKKAADGTCRCASGVRWIRWSGGYQPLVVAVRFRKWDVADLIPAPDHRAGRWLPRALAGMWEGHKGRARFRPRRRAVPADRLYGPQKRSARHCVAVYDLVRGSQAGRILGGGARWQLAVAAEDLLAYDEPAAWQAPCGVARRGAADSRPPAEKVFRADLEVTRATASLHGLTDRGEDCEADAAWTSAQFDRAWKDADVPLRIEDF